MADKRKTFNGDKYERQHNRNLNAIQRKLRKIYESAADEAANIAMLVGALGDDEYFHFDNYPITKQRIRELLQELGEQTEAVVVNGVRAEWALANDKNDALCAFVLGDKINLSFEEQRKYFRNNNAAREAFLERAEKGMNLSQRVWKYTADYKAEIEAGLSLGLGKGKDARALARELKRNLQNPDKLFRRVRDKYGILRLSKEAKNYHPGQGVYRSSYKNALRLAVTETNMAYRTADYQRYQQFDFIVGVEVHLSKTNHPVPDICDHLQGRYPKDFKFVGWHPFCRCITTSILDLSSDPKQIENVPNNFTKWVEDNHERAKGWAQAPYFIRDNRKYVGEFVTNTYDQYEKKFTRAHKTKPAMEMANKVLSSRYPQIANTELAAIYHYTRGDLPAFRHLNNQLRKGNPKEFNIAFATLMERGLQQIKPVATTTYRTIRLNKTQLKNWIEMAKNKSETIFDGFTSTSFSRDIIENFAKNKKGRKNNENDIMLIIKGKNGHPIENISQFGTLNNGLPNQREVVFSHGTKFRVISQKQITGSVCKYEFILCEE